MVKDFHVDGLLDVVHGDGEGLVPPGVEVLVDDSTLVNLLSSHFELDVRVTGTWQHMATAALSLTHMPSPPLVQRSTRTEQWLQLQYQPALRNGT